MIESADDNISDKQVEEVEQNACPTCGSCSGMFTANSMNCITEVIGMALPGNGTIAAVDAARIRLAKKTGMRVVELVREGLTPEELLRLFHQQGISNDRIELSAE